MQCTVKPSKRSHNNAIGIWVGTTADSSMSSAGNWILGIDLKHLNSKNSIWNINERSNTVWNFNSGFHFGKRRGVNADVSYYVMTNDLVSKTNDNIGQLYIGPTLGLNYFSINGKQYKYSPKLGATGGILMIIPEYKYFPESNIVVEYSADLKYRTIKDDVGRILYHIYVF